MKEINGLKIDPMIFTFRFGCKCNGECCYYGVFTDLKEYENIIRIKDKIIPLLDDTQSKNPDHWFEPPEADSDFESSVAVGTALVNDKCAFLDKDGLCSLQKLANIENSHKWKHKPLYCILFPLTIYQNTLTVDHEHIERLNSCNRFNQNGTTIFEACREELIYLLGDKGFNELEKYKNDYFNEVNIGVTQNVAEK